MQDGLKLALRVVVEVLDRDGLLFRAGAGDAEGVVVAAAGEGETEVCAEDGVEGYVVGGLGGDVEAPELGEGIFALPAVSCQLDVS